MQRPSPIIKGTNVPEQWNVPEMPSAAAVDKAREYDRLMELLKVSEKHYEHMISLTKGYIGKEMDNPIDFYNKGTLFAFESMVNDIKIMLDK